MPTAVVIGAGIGGLTTAALLTRAGWSVTVLEAHVYAGGCAGTFFHRGYRFDAGATLVGGFDPGGPHACVARLLGLTWPVAPVDPAWVVHLPDRDVTQWAPRDAWTHERERAFPAAGRFWRAQERWADLSWDLTAHGLPWPPQSLDDIVSLAQAIRPGLIAAAPQALRTVRDLAGAAWSDPALRTFLDAQLIISAQTTAAHANALYGSAALDLPRRGIYRVHQGVGGLAETLVAWLHRNGATVRFRERVESIVVSNGRAVAVKTARGLEARADVIVGNLTPWALARLLGDATPAALTRRIQGRAPTWGAFTMYAGVDEVVFSDKACHHQIVMDPNQPMGDGNSVFMSASPSRDSGRAPHGQRAVTLSTHTAVEPWVALKHTDLAAYEWRKAEYAQRLFRAAERALPGFGAGLRFHLTATPTSFERFTRRPAGMVGGFAQTSLWSAWGPRTPVRGLWMVGDSIFPGQSTAGVTLGAMRVVGALLRQR